MTPKLYKYTKITEWTESILENNEVYFNSPAVFNDPFECQLLDQYNEMLKLSPTEKFENLKCEYQRQAANGNFNPLFSHIRECYPEMVVSSDFIISKAFDYTSSRESYSDSENLLKEELFSDTGIYCVTTENDSILMWSHYADYHQGICFEFDAYKLAELGDIYEVNYVSGFHDTDSLIEAILMKSDCWSYEQEKRIIKHKWISDAPPTNPGLHKLPEKAVTGIIFGCKTPFNIIHRYTGLALKNNPDVRTYMAERLKSEFKLKISEYDINSYVPLSAKQ